MAASSRPERATLSRSRATAVRLPPAGRFPLLVASLLCAPTIALGAEVSCEEHYPGPAADVISRECRARPAGNGSAAGAIIGLQDDDAFLAAREAITEGRIGEAIARLDLLARERPESAAVALLLGHAYRAADDLVGAVRSYTQSGNLDPSDPEPLMALARVQEEVGDLATAASLYERAIALDPELPAAYRQAAGVEVKLQRHARVIGHLSRYLQLRPDDLESLNVLGIAHYLNQDHTAAIESFERALRLNPDFAAAHFGLGVVLAKRPADHERALEHLRRALIAFPDNADAHYYVGRILADRGELQEAVDELERSIDLNPDRLDAHYRLGQAYVRAGNREAGNASLARFTQMQQRSNEAAGAEKRLTTEKDAVTAALESGDLGRAALRLEELIATYPDDPDLLTVAAKFRSASGDRTGALGALGRALEVDPRHWEALQLLGLLLHQAGRQQEAREALERCLLLKPLSINNYAVLGNVLTALNEPAAAADAYRTAATLDPDNLAHHLNLATAYSRLGLTQLEEQAMADYHRLLERLPQN